MDKWLLPILAVAIVALIGCSAPSQTSVNVPWVDYAPGLQARLDAAAAARDCAGLQAQFDAADASNMATMARTGHNNAELMKYIDATMRRVGCY